MRKGKIVKGTLLLVFLVLTGSCMPQFFHRNKGKSISHGSPGKGSLENGYLIDYRLKNAKYFSLTSYYIFGNGYLNSKVYHTLKDAYAACEKTCPERKFYYMECSSRKGGKQLVHRTHRNGMSVDFMVPLKKGNRPATFYDHWGIWHYLLNFDSSGKLILNSNVEIDFETMAKHILALDNAAKKQGLRIKKVILKINLKDDFYRSPTGKEIKRRGIYFALALSPVVDKLHDDHYHIDFALR